MDLLPVATFEERLPRMLADLQAPVEIESPTTDKAAVDRLGAVLRGQMEGLGARVEVDRQTVAGDHLIGRWNGVSQGDGLLLMCHMDTVYDLGTLANFPCRQEDGRLHGPGTLDMKASLVICLHALAALQEAGRLPARPITLLCTSDEETGSETSRALIESLARGHALTLCMEPALPDGALKTWRRRDLRRHAQQRGAGGLLRGG
ncbi:MAG: M20/M25/M40 family metallo-hydrolase [Chloroflexi bacterium]|nr:M20/M25/M40 family metallo-hydrolase [Chloroflexota bacterium]